jgi:hypothetical protein
MQREREELDNERARLMAREEELASRDLAEAAGGGICVLDDMYPAQTEDFSESGGPTISLEQHEDGQERDEWSGESYSDAGPGEIPAPQLRGRAQELTELLRVERDEIAGAEDRLEALRFDIQRLRSWIGRSREKHQARTADLENRLNILSVEQTTLEREREPLILRLRELDLRAASLQASLEEAQRFRSELDQEAQEIAGAEEELAERQRSLQADQEEERHRLRLQQAELRRRAAELAKVVRRRRQMIEDSVKQRQAELDREEFELQARRMSLEEARRKELEASLGDLAHLSGVDLHEVEAGIEARQAELARQLEEMAPPIGGPSFSSGTRPSGIDGAPQPRAPDTAGPEWKAGGAPSCGTERLDSLIGEIEALRGAAIATGNRNRDQRKGDEGQLDAAGGVHVQRTRTHRTGGYEAATLTEQNAPYRAGGPGEQEGGKAASGH